MRTWAFQDALIGKPTDDALKTTRRFCQVGISFDYPSVLRVRVVGSKQAGALCAATSS